MTPEERLEEIYAKLPAVECKGLCQNSCGPIEMSALERQRIAERGIQIDAYSLSKGDSWRSGAQTHRCPALTSEGRCSVYDIRPFICRAWGAGRQAMACEYGCKPEGPRLRSVELLNLMYDTYVVAGGPPGWKPEDVEMYRELLQDPETARLMAAYVGGQQELEVELRGRMHQVAKEKGWIT